MSNVKAFITDVNRDGFHEVAEAIRVVGGKDAKDVNYDNTVSGIEANNVQDAIDEVAGDVDDLEIAVNGKVNKSGDTMSGNLTIQKSLNTDIFLIVKDTTNKQIAFGFDTSGKCGIYDYSIDDWIFHMDGTDVYVNNTKVPYNGGELALKSDINKGSINVTADGVKTYKTLLNELYALIDDTKLSSTTYIVFSSSIFRYSRPFDGGYSFFLSYGNASLEIIDHFLVHPSNSLYTEYLNGNISSYQDGVAASGAKIELYY